MNLVFIIFLLFVVWFITQRYKVHEAFSVTVPIRYIPPRLYPATGPVDMLIMKKKLLGNGYRFQNSLNTPASINCGGDPWAYPEAYMQRTGNFKERMFVEPFTGSPIPSTNPVIETFMGASQATFAQVKSRDELDDHLMGREGTPIIDSEASWNHFYDQAGLDREREINYRNSQFSWGDVINRFYNTQQYQYRPDIVI